MGRRAYRLGKREASVDRTREAILGAAHDEVAAGRALSLGAVARAAGVSRITVYNQFGSRAGLLQAVSGRTLALPRALPTSSGARTELRERIAYACSVWASDAGLFRHLPRTGQNDESRVNRQLAERLAASDELRPGCSIKEAEDVIGMLTAFEVFDPLYRDGRRSPVAVAEILMRLASGILS